MPERPGRGDAHDLERAAQEAVEVAMAAGAEQAEAWCEDAVERTVRVYERAVESLSEARTRGVGVRVLSGGRAGYAYGSDLSGRGLAAVARAAREGGAVTAPDEHAGLPENGGAAEVVGLASAELPRWSNERRLELALAVERAARERDALISNVEDTVYSDAELRVALANSRGFVSSYERTGCYAYAHAFAGEGSDLMTGMAFGIGRGPEMLDPEAIGREAADRALALHGARKAQSRRCPVVLDAHVAAAFASVVGEALCADAVQRGRSPFAGRVGAEVGAALVKLVDDGLDPEGPVTAPFDGEGVPQGRTVLVEDGRLRSFLFDAYTARKAGRAPTGNARRDSYRSSPSVGATNLVLEPGGTSADELVSAAGDGFYAMNVTGLHSGVNPASGSFSVGASGRLIEGGELGAPVREVTIASDIVSMLTSVAAVGSETRWVPLRGAVKAPPLLVAEMTVAGA